MKSKRPKGKGALRVTAPDRKGQRAERAGTGAAKWISPLMQIKKQIP
ncbi:hypothetical protein SARI_03313 [Salmonella enterica subsp. arizonae serovar 62:z4,z23:-]|uniref:Uncharacterized protein n=1 Tax=Salmonella arizonae (strain ATCC BAA-731 / CDC346-86 / RSK2980) TaxID=41514 RepID=A9MFS9_SALAR|nr:hypothetical protein SARI_03313 [Salmonella enterica subsp. arizonae serovar 62:z4,z23:-]